MRFICPPDCFEKHLCKTRLWCPPWDLSTKRVQQHSDCCREVCTTFPSMSSTLVITTHPQTELNTHFFPNSALKIKIQESKRRPLMEKDKRILEELRSLHCDPHPYFSIFPSEADFSKWESWPQGRLTVIIYQASFIEVILTHYTLFVIYWFYEYEYILQFLNVEKLKKCVLFSVHWNPQRIFDS